MKKIQTLCLIIKDGRILLGLKKRGFGAGRWNGFGGKVKDGEVIEAAARRELQEEAGLEVVRLVYRGVINFTFVGRSEILEVHFFSTSEFSGEPRETEEMKPQWFDVKDIPYEAMWPDDRYWLPLMLAGKNFRGEFHFKNQDEIIDYNIEEIDNT